MAKGTTTQRPTSTEAWVPELPSDETFGQRLRWLRWSLGDPSVDEIAKKCGVSNSTWRSWEKGRVESPHNIHELTRQIARCVKIHYGKQLDFNWLLWDPADRPSDLRGPGSPCTPAMIPALAA